MAKQVQRIGQDMGWGVRDGDDYCAVLLLGANLAVAKKDARHLACSRRGCRRNKS
ncbi:hypothetical protein PJ985_22220 [Streptomyces sp. ACA25]|uniref:hypothetical protein n=1 Tax=Streptomyces sp. ACA25 TaxID=3022596 RepID=UPI0023080286|nr:hypothetical protein [Streptomyces sp. ACA25]MDB1090272.1 hypothetical protein [Streptomyces sp. ACA25]